jgi:hypothetical protein
MPILRLGRQTDWDIWTLERRLKRCFLIFTENHRKGLKLTALDTTSPKRLYSNLSLEPL